MVDICYDEKEDMLFISDGRNIRTKEGFHISDNFTLHVDPKDRIKAIEISFAYEFFKEFDPANFKKNVLKEVKKAEFDIKEYRDLILIDVVFIYKGKKINEKLVFLKENFE